MMNEFTISGLTFSVQGDGFRGPDAQADFERAVERLEWRMRRMNAAKLAKMHAAGVAWVAADCDGERPEWIGRLEAQVHRAATRGWHRPEAALISVNALPA